jgi:hypothetical protein
MTDVVLIHNSKQKLILIKLKIMKANVKSPDSQMTSLATFVYVALIAVSLYLSYAYRLM